MGGIIGLLAGFKHHAIPTSRSTSTDIGFQKSKTHPQSAVQILQSSSAVRSNSNLHQYLERLLMYNKFGPPHVQRIITEMEHAQAITNRVAVSDEGTFTTCGNLSAHQANVVESIRILRSQLASSKGNATLGVMTDFDDIAAGIQTACNDNSHNVTMAVQGCMLK